MEFSHCGVGFISSLKNVASYELLNMGLKGLQNVEHRGGASEDGFNGDGAGIMASVPHELLGIDESKAVAMLFAPSNPDRYKLAISVFEESFRAHGLNISRYREVPINENAVSKTARSNMPMIIQAIIDRPSYCRTMGSFDELLYSAKQSTRSLGKEKGLIGELYFSSLSSRTIIYKALCTSIQLSEFYLDLKNPSFKTKFVLFHRRFSTNTLPSWDKVQPFRLIAHNGEINTIEGNRAAARSRELALGLREDQVLTMQGASDSGNFNEMVESLKYRSSIPFLKDILAIMVPPAESDNSSYFKFWSRAMEPWDGPALIAYCDGKKIGARLDRSGFRPCRWKVTENFFALCSETGAFEIDPAVVLKQGVLSAGQTVNIHMYKGSVDFLNPDKLEENEDVFFDSRLKNLPYIDIVENQIEIQDKLKIFYYTKEDLLKELYPMIEDGKGPIGSMGDTATLAAMSEEHRSIYDYFYQDFAQVTNPPLDYIRESLVTSMKVYLGRKPNVFSPKELIPPYSAIELESPILSLGQMDRVKQLKNCRIIDICFDRNFEKTQFLKFIDECVHQAVDATKNGINIIVLSDRNACYDKPAVPSIIVMRAIQIKLNQLGVRLKISLIVDSGEIRNGHQVAVLIAFGASAICPYLSLAIARDEESLKAVEHLTASEREQRLIKAFSESLLKIMAKRGISVVRSYQGSELFTIIGFDKEILERLFINHPLTIAGFDFEKLLDEIKTRTKKTMNSDSLPNNFLYKEHAGGKLGEKHSLTTKRTKILHNLLEQEYKGIKAKEWIEFKEEIERYPINIRDFFDFKFKAEIEEAEVISREKILSHFGSGAMSYGSISAETQRDIFLAMDNIGGRSNSGEGGENPYYYSDGITAKIKQLASGRFGVTAKYLVIANEIQIKMAQGAKPGEGGQLMGVKVDEHIAKARYANKGVNLISPPPHHDIYSIEDLKQLIYELKQLAPKAKVSVKLVSGKNIGAIAMGVVKAGADIILISGGNGGTGAANLMSMKHAGLPWEIGLVEVHKALSSSGLRDKVVLRVDGGLFTGKDIVTAAIYGAEQFDFGKILLVSAGCIMARVCEKNTCPAGIATQDPKFKLRYKGTPEKIEKFLTYVADEVQYYLKCLGKKDLKSLIGCTELLGYELKHEKLRKKLNLNLEYFFKDIPSFTGKTIFENNELSTINKTILDQYSENDTIELDILSTDRAVATSLAGVKALEEFPQNTRLKFHGSAGQGFAAFATKGMDITLFGEANDSVAKGISGGCVSILPSKKSNSKNIENVLVGNTCLFGATGGEFYLNGYAGDRFAVRNSGATAIVEGVGLHACEYMTGGVVVILGNASKNIGAGMSGGKIYLMKENLVNVNRDFLTYSELSKEDEKELKLIYQNYIKLLKEEEIEYQDRTDQLKNQFMKLVPRG